MPKKPIEEASAQTDAQPTEAPKAKAPKGVFFYWIKIESYITDEVIWKPGLYQTSEKIARLAKSPLAYVEVFEDEIPEVILSEIAKRYGIATEYVVDGKRKIKPAEEILATLVVSK
jgi:hypothetical protein